MEHISSFIIQIEDALYLFDSEFNYLITRWCKFCANNKSNTRWSSSVQFILYDHLSTSIKESKNNRWWLLIDADGIWMSTIKQYFAWIYHYYVTLLMLEPGNVQLLG